MSLQVLTSLPMGPIDTDNWNERPLSSCQKIGRWSSHLMAWCPVDLAIIGLSIGILCTALPSITRDDPLGLFIGVPLTTIALAIVDFLYEQQRANTVISYDYAIKEGCLALKQNDLPFKTALEIAQEKENLFIEEHENLFNEKHLANLLFQYWNNYSLSDSDIEFQQKESRLCWLNDIVDRESTLPFNAPFSKKTCITNLMKVSLGLGAAGISTYLATSVNELTNKSTGLQAVCWTHASMTYWSFFQTILKFDLYKKLKQNHSDLIDSIKHTKSKNFSYSLMLAYLGDLPPIGTESDSESERSDGIDSSSERKHGEVKIDVLYA